MNNTDDLKMAFDAGWEASRVSPNGYRGKVREDYFALVRMRRDTLTRAEAVNRVVEMLMSTIDILHEAGDMVVDNNLWEDPKIVAANTHFDTALQRTRFRPGSPRDWIHVCDPKINPKR